MFLKLFHVTESEGYISLSKIVQFQLLLPW